MRQFMRMAASILLLQAALVSTAAAGNWTVLTRYFQTPPSKTYHPQAYCPDCHMTWHPVRSVMHPNVLPPGMKRPEPLRIPRPGIMPPPPSFDVNHPGVHAKDVHAAAGYMWPAECIDCRAAPPVQLNPPQPIPTQLRPATAVEAHRGGGRHGSPAFTR